MKKTVKRAAVVVGALLFAIGIYLVAVRPYTEMLLRHS